MLALDGDVLASGAAAVANGARDYEGFWRYLLSLAGEAHRNDLVPPFACICLPSQVITGPDLGVVVLSLALVSDDATVRRRIAHRENRNPSLDLDFNAAFDAKLRECTVPSPHTFTVLDTASLATALTIAAGEEWATALI